MNHTDPIFDLITKELNRQTDGLEMIPSENYVSADVRSVLGSVLSNKYSEGYPGKRYYGGNEFIDEVEKTAVERAKTLFGVPHVNVQPYSGTPANLAVYLATCNPGDTIMGLNLPDGGHLSHGWKVSASSIFYKSVPYHVKPSGKVDIDEVWSLARANKPKLIWCGATAYVYPYEFETFAEIADAVGAYFAADIAHVAGLVVGGVHPSPVPYAHIVTTTTHKTLRGPRGAMIMVTDKGLKKDPELSEKIDKAVFPGLQGGPHDHQTGAIAVALSEAATPEFRQYAAQVVKNAARLAEVLKSRGLKLVGDGTKNHLILIDLVPVFGPGGGVIAQEALGAAGITVNKNTVPLDPSSPFYPSGVRLGTPAITTRGMGEAEMETVGSWIAETISEFKNLKLPADKTERQQFIRNLKITVSENPKLKAIKSSIKDLCQKYPLP
jgi:glycine hydroxymethyltransferase